MKPFPARQFTWEPASVPPSASATSTGSWPGHLMTGAPSHSLRLLDLPALGRAPQVLCLTALLRNAFSISHVPCGGTTPLSMEAALGPRMGKRGGQCLATYSHGSTCIRPPAVGHIQGFTLKNFFSRTQGLRSVPTPESPHSNSNTSSMPPSISHTAPRRSLASFHHLHYSGEQKPLSDCCPLYLSLSLPLVMESPLSCFWEAQTPV